MVELEPFTEADIPTLMGWIDSPEFLLQWGGPAFSYPLRRTQVRTQLFAPDGSVKSHLRAFRAVDGERRQVVGHIELAGIDPENRSARVARVLVGPSDLRGRGIGTQMVEAVLRIGFEQMGLHRIELGVFDFNQSAVRCYEKAGFRIEGLLRDNRKLGDCYWSSYVMSILEDEWRAALEQR